MPHPPDTWKKIKPLTYHRLMAMTDGVNCWKCGKELGTKKKVLHRYTRSPTKRYCLDCGRWLIL